MEPERKIEKWLRAYAKKRRGQAGPVKLHPATRRLLQSEIARTTPKPDDEDDSVSLWEVLRQQWAFLLAFALCVFLGATMLYIPLAASKKKTELSVAMNSTNNIAAAPMMNPATGLALPSPAPPAPPSPTVASASDEPAVAMAPPPPGPTEAPASEGTLMARSQAKSEQTSETRLAYKGLRNVFQNAAGPSQASPILANFEVQQNGNAIRVVDGDGSVYEGSLELATQQAINKTLSPQDQTQAVQNRFMQNSASVAAGLPSQSIALARNGFELAQNYFFRVHGTNRTTKQTIEFTGNLLANAAMATNMTQALADNNSVSGTVTASGGGGGGGGGGGSFGGFGGAMREKETTNQFAQLPWSSLRISGMAVVNHTNQIQINAAPVFPAKN